MSNVIYSSDPGLIIGFHGCDASVRDKIVNATTTLKASRNVYDWLGSGIYFWQNNYERALDFAQNPPGNSRIRHPAVLGAVLSLGNCLDLSDKRYIDLVQISYTVFRKFMERKSVRLPQNKNVQNSKDKLLRELDCRVIEEIHDTQRELGKTPFDTVRGIFIEGNPLYENAGFYDKTHVQICVRNPNCIKGFFMPRQEVTWNDWPINRIA